MPRIVKLLIKNLWHDIYGFHPGNNSATDLFLILSSKNHNIELIICQAAKLRTLGMRLVCQFIVNRIIHGLEAEQNNRTYLCYNLSRFMQNWYLSYHMPIVLLHKQRIAECLTWPFMTNRNNWPN